MATNSKAATTNGTTNQARIRTRRALLASSQARRLATRWLRESVTKLTVQTGVALTGTRRESLTNVAAKSTASHGFETAASSAASSDASDQPLSSLAMPGKGQQRKISFFRLSRDFMC